MSLKRPLSVSVAMKCGSNIEILVTVAFDFSTAVDRATYREVVGAAG